MQLLSTFNWEAALWFARSSILLIYRMSLDSDSVILHNMQHVWGYLRAVDYLAQMMVIAINETMHTPPTK